VEFHLKQEQFRAYYQTLYAAWGRQHWWPAQSRFEIIVGAFLTQNTAWRNVELSLRRLRKSGLLSLAGIRNVPRARLEGMVRSSGYFRQKARRLKNFVACLDERYRGSLRRMFSQPTDRLREELLALDGIGPETADSILLYAGQHPVFVVDAYTRRILDRHGLVAASAPYEEIRRFCESALTNVAVGDQTADEAKNRRGPAGSCHPPSRMSLAKRSPIAQVYNDMHGLIVGVGKNYCLKSQPKCEECPLRGFLPKM
jgi:endonuclease-3 related protein